MNSLKGSSLSVLTEMKFGCCLITAIAWLFTVAGCTSHSCCCVVPACWVTDCQLQATGRGIPLRRFKAQALGVCVWGLWTPRRFRQSTTPVFEHHSYMPTTPSRNTRRLRVGRSMNGYGLLSKTKCERAGSWKPRLHTVQGRTSSAMLLHRHAAGRPQRIQQACRPRANVGVSGGRSCVCSGDAGRVQSPHLLMPTRPTPNLHIPRALPTGRPSACTAQHGISAAQTTALFRMRHARLSTSPNVACSSQPRTLIRTR